MIVIDLIIWVSMFMLLSASYFDLRTGEIPEMVSRGFIFSILLMASAQSILNFNPSYVINSMVMGTAYFLFGYLMFYLGEWGGGDVKLLAGIGLSLGLLGAENYFLDEIFPYYISYFINMAIVSSPYVILYSLILGLLKPEVFQKFFENLKRKITVVGVVMSFLPAIVAGSLGMGNAAFLYLLLPILLILSIYLRIIEGIALQKTINVNKLKEGDMVASDVVLDNKVIARRRDMDGLNNKQISEIQKLASEGKIPEEIRIRWGIKFAPILLFAFIFTVYLGNLLEILIKWFIGY